MFWAPHWPRGKDTGSLTNQVRSKRFSIRHDNNMRAEFLGPEGDTRWNLDRLRRSTRHFDHQALDIRSSILEAFDLIERLTGKKMRYESVDRNRKSDHVCYITNLTRFRSHYPEWDVTKSLSQIICETIDDWNARLGGDVTPSIARGGVAG